MLDRPNTVEIPRPGVAPDRLKTLGMVVKTETGLPPRANPFYSHVIVGIEEACRRNQINLLFATLPVDEYNLPVEVPKILSNSDADGFLMVGTFVDETITSILGKQSRPIVLVDAYSNTASFDTVVSDNFQAAYQAVEYLIHKGHRHIGLIGSEPTSYPSLKQRRGGYSRALRENEITSAYIANFNICNESGHDPTIWLMREHPQITALFGVNDLVAVNAVRALQEIGLRVPQDVSVIGYDDIDLAVNSKPALTTLHVDTVSMGRSAVQLLMSRLEYPDAARMTITLHPTLIERESVVDHT
jgi:LacI family transcriptional regulator